MSKLSIIVAMAQNRVIGLNNGLPWRCPEDLQYFKERTMGHHMLMGRKTFESIGKPLPGRTTVIVSRNTHLRVPACIVAHSLPEAISHCWRDTEIFIVGGADLYAQALPLVDTMYITEIQMEAEGDAYFPYFDKAEWLEMSREPHSQMHPYYLEYHFVTYQRKTK